MARESRDRHCWGDTWPIYLPVTAATSIKTGDMVTLAAGVDLAVLAAASNNDFVGVAMQDSVSADPATIRVATEGVFEFDCASDTFLAGEFVTYSTNGQTVIGTNDLTTGANAIGRVWKRVATAATKVQVRINTKVKISNPT